MEELTNLSDGKPSKDKLELVNCPKCNGVGCTACGGIGKVTKAKAKRISNG